MKKTTVLVLIGVLLIGMAWIVLAGNSRYRTGTIDPSRVERRSGVGIRVAFEVVMAISGAPIARANVLVTKEGYTQTRVTDNRGYADFTLPGINTSTPEPYQYSVRKTGFYTVSGTGRGIATPPIEVYPVTRVVIRPIRPMPNEARR